MSARVSVGDVDGYERLLFVVVRVLPESMGGLAHTCSDHESDG
jgi:hypothetical protein